MMYSLERNGEGKLRSIQQIWIHLKVAMELMCVYVCMKVPVRCMSVTTLQTK